MILTMYILMMISSTFTLCLASTPIILGMNILIMSLLLSASFAALISSWFAMLIFLIYVGGMLVMFAYFLALTPNQHMSNHNNLVYILFSLIVITTMSFISNIKIPIMSQFMQGSSFLYTKSNAPILIILALILLFTMVIVVKMTHRSKGPLRPFN